MVTFIKIAVWLILNSLVAIISSHFHHININANKRNHSDTLHDVDNWKQVLIGLKFC